METIVYKIEFQDGREFRVFCANRKQKERFQKTVHTLNKVNATVSVIINGIHNIKQWEQIVSKL